MTEQRGRLTAAQVSRFLGLIDQLPIEVDDAPSDLVGVVAAGRRHDLSGYERISPVPANKRDMGMVSVSFFCMAIALRQLNVGVVYAIWSAAGIAAVSVAGAVLFHEHLTWEAIAGMAVIVLGVTILVGSGSTHHA